MTPPDTGRAMGRGEDYRAGYSAALRSVLELIDRQALPVCMVEGTAEMRGAAAALMGVRGDVVRMGRLAPEETHT